MREQISRLMDGDLEGAEAEAAFRELKRVDGLEYWACCHVIGDALRRSGAPIAGFSERFARRLEDEPTVLAPKPSVHASRLPLAWAAAATIAAVLVVARLFVPPPLAVCVAADTSFEDRALKAQLKMADRAGAAHAAIVGERELEAGTVTLRRLEDGQQEDVAAETLAGRLAHETGVG